MLDVPLLNFYEHVAKWWLCNNKHVVTNMVFSVDCLEIQK